MDTPKTKIEKIVGFLPLTSASQCPQLVHDNSWIPKPLGQKLKGKKWDFLCVSPIMKRVLKSESSQKNEFHGIFSL